jgi:hypothetical protein
MRFALADLSGAQASRRTMCRGARKPGTPIRVPIETRSSLIGRAGPPGPNQVENAMAIQEQEESHSISHIQDNNPRNVTWRLRGDDALMRAASEVAAPSRRLLAALRDCHGETTARIAGLQRLARSVEATPCRDIILPTLARLVEEAEEQLYRLEMALAQLRERPAPHARFMPAAEPAYANVTVGTHAQALLRALAAEEQRGAKDTQRVRDLAHLAGHHMVARLLDLTVEERGARARHIAAAFPPH